MPTTTIAIIIFAITYLSLLIFSNYRAWIALGSAALFIALGIMPLGEVFSAVDWNVIMMIAGTMGTVALFIESRMPARLADLIINRVPNVKWAIISLSVFAAVISAFVDNVATVLMVAPVAIGIAKKLKMSPVSSIIAIAISSNLEGAATLVGDTTSILLGGYANMNFMDFFFMDGKMGMFWIVQIAAVAATFVLWTALRKESRPIESETAEEVNDMFPTWLLLGTIGLLVAASFMSFPEGFPINGLICVSVYVIGLLRSVLIKKDTGIVIRSLKEIDIFTLLLLASLFVVIAGIGKAGVIDMVAGFFKTASNGNLFVMYTMIVWFSVILSAFIDNIPYVATMLPVTAVIAGHLGINPTVLYFGLLVGATLGGNLTPIGASANIAGIGILRKNGSEVRNWDFMKISIPFTLTAVVTGYVLVWLFWGLGG